MIQLPLLLHCRGNFSFLCTREVLISRYHFYIVLYVHLAQMKHCKASSTFIGCQLSAVDEGRNRFHLSRKGRILFAFLAVFWPLDYFQVLTR